MPVGFYKTKIFKKNNIIQNYRRDFQRHEYYFQRFSTGQKVLRKDNLGNCHNYNRLDTDHKKRFYKLLVCKQNELFIDYSNSKNIFFLNVIQIRLNINKVNKLLIPTKPPQWQWIRIYQSECIESKGNIFIYINYILS